MNQEDWNELLLSWSRPNNSSNQSNQENCIGSSSEIDGTVSSITSPRLTVSTPSPTRSPINENSPFKLQHISHLSFPQQESTNSVGSFSPEGQFSSCSEAVGYASLPNESNYSIVVVEPQPGAEAPAAASVSHTTTEFSDPQLQAHHQAAASLLQFSLEEQKIYHILHPHQTTSPNVISSVLTNTLVDEGRLPVARSTPARATPVIGNGSVRLHEFYESFVSSELLTGEPPAQILEIDVDEETGTDAGAEMQEVEVVANEEERVVEAEKMDQVNNAVVEPQIVPHVEQNHVVARVGRGRKASTRNVSAGGRRNDREHRVLRGRVSRAAFKCAVCGKPYRQRTHLRKHLNSHVVEMCADSQGPGALIRCSVCNRTFGKKSGLTSHIRSHVLESSAETLEESD